MACLQGIQPCGCGCSGCQSGSQSSKTFNVVLGSLTGTADCTNANGTFILPFLVDSGAGGCYWQYVFASGANLTVQIVQSGGDTYLIVSVNHFTTLVEWAKVITGGKFDCDNITSMTIPLAANFSCGGGGATCVVTLA